MAIRRVTRIINGESREVLGLNDILDQIGARPGTRIDFLSLADVTGIPLVENDIKNPIILPDSFIGKDVVLSAETITLSRSTYAYPLSGGSVSVTITTTPSNGVFSLGGNPSWVVPIVTFGKGSTTITFYGLDNSAINSDARSGSVKFYGKNNTIKATLNLSQPGNPVVATISPTGTVDLDGSEGNTNIVVRLTTSLSPSTPVLGNTTDFTISEPTTSTSGGITTYTYTLGRFQTSTSKSTTLDISYSGDGYNAPFPTVTFNQAAFQPTISRTPTSLSYTSGGGTKYYDVTSNTNWTATIASPSFAYQHSLQSDRNFTFDALTGTSAGDRIYVKIGGNGSANARTGTATITTTYGTNDVNTTVSLSQAGADTWDNDDITISGFAVASNGNITAPTVTTTGDISYTIEYSDTATFATTVTAAAGFDLVSTDTVRYVRVSVTVPAGYSNTSDTFTKTAEATQAGLPIFKSSQITFSTTTVFRVNSYGTITVPNVSVPSGITVTRRYTTGDNNTGTAYTTFPKVSADTTRYANAVVVVPGGYYNEGSTVIKTVSDVQEDFDPTISLTTPNTGILPQFTIASQVKSFSFTSNHSWVSNIDGNGFEQSLVSTSGFTTDDITGSGNATIYVKALKNLGEPRAGSVGVSTNFGHLDNSIGVLLSQDGEPTFGISDWTGTVSINRQTGAVSATTGNSLATPTFTPTSFALVSSTTNRTVSVTVKAPDGYNNHNSLVTGNVTVSQLHFVPSVSTNVSARTFAYTGETLSYTITSNTTWSATISGAGFSHSTSSTSGFKTTAITGTSAGDTIYVKAAGHLGAERYGTATVTTTFGGNDVDTDVDLTQLEAPTFGTGDISFTRNFAVSYTGAITAPITNPAATAIVYSTTQNGTSVSSFGQVSINTTRWCRVSVTVPAGYQNTGNTVTRTNITAVQPFKATIDATPETHTFSNVGSYRDYAVSSNTTWEVSNYPSWITIDDTTGGGTDTAFRATAAAQANPALARSGTLRVSTNTAANGIFYDDVSFSQPSRSTWSFSNIPALPYEAWQKEILNEFSKNIPFVFDYMLTTFKQGQFAVYTTNTTNSKSGAALSSSSNKFTAGDKTFVVTRNTNLLTSDTSLGFDVGHWVSVSEIKVLGSDIVTKYMVGTVKSWNSTTKTLVVTIPANNSNFTSNKTIESDNTTTNYTSWEIYQISGTASHSVTLISRAENKTSSPITAILSVNDTNNAYSNASLIQTVTQSLPPFEGWIYNPYNLSNASQASWGEIGVGGTYTRNSVWTDSDTTAELMSFSVRTTYQVSMTVTITANGISLRAPGSTTSVSSITFNTQRFDTSPNVRHFELYATAPAAGGSRTCSLSFTSTTPSSSTELDIVLNRDEAASVSTVTNTVDNSTVRIVNER